MDKVILHPEGTYKIEQLGPIADWSFKGDDGNPIPMKGYSVKFEGIADWGTINQSPTTDAPVVGESVEGHIEDGGKFGLKFVKKRKGGFGGKFGGGKSSPGAQWSAAMATAATVVAAYVSSCADAKSKPKTMADFLERVNQVAPVIKTMVDGHAGTVAEEVKPVQAKEEGLPVIDTENNPVVVADVKEDELGSW